MCHMHNDIWCVRWDLSLILQRRKLRFSEVKQHAHSPSLDAKQTLWAQWPAGVLVFHSLPPNVLEVQPGIFFLLNFPFLPPKVLIPCCCQCVISENVCFICSYHRFQNGNSSPSQRSSLQRVTMKRLSHMTCPSMVHPGGRAGALRGGVQVLPAQRRVLEAEGLLLPESKAQVRTGHRALGLWSGGELRPTADAARLHGGAQDGSQPSMSLMLMVFRPGCWSQHRNVTEERCVGQGTPGPCK